MNARIEWSCRTCGTGVDAPDKGLGRAIVAAWKTEHQGHDIREDPTR